MTEEQELKILEILGKASDTVIKHSVQMNKLTDAMIALNNKVMLLEKRVYKLEKTWSLGR